MENEKEKEKEMSIFKAMGTVVVMCGVVLLGGCELADDLFEASPNTGVHGSTDFESGTYGRPDVSQWENRYHPDTSYAGGRPPQAKSSGSFDPNAHRRSYNEFKASEEDGRSNRSYYNDYRRDRDNLEYERHYGRGNRSGR